MMRKQSSLATPSSSSTMMTSSTGGSRTNSSKPFMKDFQWYKQTFGSKQREIKDLLKRFARMEDASNDLKTQDQ